MAERRMFSKQIIDSDAFLNMPLSSQVLYFHLSMRADDDGFINNPIKITRMVGSNTDDFNILVAKKFILTFESGIIVIKHWLMHNYIRNDRYKETVYREEKAQLGLKEDKSYTLDTNGLPGGIPNGNPGKVRLELGKSKVSIKPLVGFEAFWTAYPKKIGKDKCRKWFDNKRPTPELIENMIQSVDLQKTTEQWTRENGRFIPHPYTWLNRGGWEDEVTPNRWNMIEEAF